MVIHAKDEESTNNLLKWTHIKSRTTRLDPLESAYTPKEKVVLHEMHQEAERRRAKKEQKAALKRAEAANKIKAAETFPQGPMERYPKGCPKHFDVLMRDRIATGAEAFLSTELKKRKKQGSLPALKGDIRSKSVASGGLPFSFPQKGGIYGAVNGEQRKKEASRNDLIASLQRKGRKDGGSRRHPQIAGVTPLMHNWEKKEGAKPSPEMHREVFDQGNPMLEDTVYSRHFQP